MNLNTHIKTPGAFWCLLSRLMEELPTSFQVLSRFWANCGTHLAAADRLLGLAIVDIWNRTGRKWKTTIWTNQLAEMCNLTPRSVQRSRKKLEAARLIRCQLRKGGQADYYLGNLLLDDRSDTSVATGQKEATLVSHRSDTGVACSDTSVAPEATPVSHVILRRNTRIQGHTQEAGACEDFEIWLNELLGLPRSKPFAGPMKADWAKIVAGWRAAGELESNQAALACHYSEPDDDEAGFRWERREALIEHIDEALAKARKFQKKKGVRGGLNGHGKSAGGLRKQVESLVRTMPEPAGWESVALEAFSLDRWPTEAPEWADLNLDQRIEVLAFWNRGRSVEPGPRRWRDAKLKIEALQFAAEMERGAA